MKKHNRLVNTSKPKYIIKMYSYAAVIKKYSYDGFKQKPIDETVICNVPAQEGYYKSEASWSMVSREEATQLTHKDARNLAGRLKALGYHTSIERL